RLVSDWSSDVCSSDLVPSRGSTLRAVARAPLLGPSTPWERSRGGTLTRTVYITDFCEFPEQPDCEMNIKRRARCWPCGFQPCWEIGRASCRERVYISV